MGSSTLNMHARDLMTLLKDVMKRKKEQASNPLNDKNSWQSRARAYNQREYERLNPTFAEKTDRLKLGSAERVAQTRAGAVTDAAQTRANAYTGAAQLRGGALRDVAERNNLGAMARARLMTQSNQSVANTQAKASRDAANIRANRPQYHYGENTNTLGETTGFTVFKDGQRMMQDQDRAGPTDWTKNLEEEHFPQAADVLQRRVSKMKPEEVDSFYDDLFMSNPNFGRYLRENRQKKSTSIKKNPPKSKKNTLGNYAAEMAQRPGQQFMKNLTAPYRWGKQLANTELPEWLR